MTPADDTTFYTCSYSRGTAYFVGAFMGVLAAGVIGYAANNRIVVLAIILAFCALAAYYCDITSKKSSQRGDEKTGNDDDTVP